MGAINIGSTASTLGVVSELAARLADEGVRYCHWKSNEAIGRSLLGENDLDLLVDPADAGRFRSVLASMGAVRGRSRKVVIPGIEDHFLRDHATGRIVHVQPHWELVVGDDMTKSFRLPVERLLLASLIDRGLPVPAPEAEYLVFLLRMAIKHCPPEALAARKGRLTVTERRELAWLESSVEAPRLAEISSEGFSFIDPALWPKIRHALEPDASLLARARLGREVLKAVEADGRRSPRADAVLKVWRRLRHRTTPTTKALAHGGRIVGVVGGDGSGKSTLVRSLFEQFDDAIDVRMIHLGKPPRSLLTRVGRRALRPLRDRGGFDATKVPPWTRFERHPGLVFSLWYWLIARDRLREYRRMRRAAGTGALVISDRFPLPALRSMDCPRLQGLPPAGRLSARLARSEAAMYRKIHSPDLLLVVRVPPHVAVERRPEQDREFVERRAREIWDLGWPDSGVVVLDGTLPPGELASRAAAHVWSVL